MDKSINQLVLVLCCIFSTQAFAQVEISEYSASNLNSFPDLNQKYEDWIEVHNTTDAPVDISNWGLSDKETKPLKWLFPTNTILGPDDYLVVWCSGRDTYDGQYHSNFKLTQTKGNEFVILSDPNGNQVDGTPYELTMLEHSRVKVNGEWLVSVSPSPGNGNQTDILNGYTEQPTLSLEAGFYEGEVTVSIESNDPTARLVYTTDGFEPTFSSPEYTGPITITETTVLKAKNMPISLDRLPGKIAWSTYFIDDTSTLPVFSIASDEVQNLANGNGALIPIGTIEYFNADLKLDGRAYGSLNRHGQDSWALDHRSLDWVTRDEMGYTKDIESKLFNYSDRTSHQRVMLRASGDDNYPAVDDQAHQGSCHIRDEYVHELAQKGGMKLDVRAVERVVVFLNGDYWGVYGLRERPVDHDYTGEYYDQGKYDLQYLLTWGNSWAEYGGEQAFEDWAVLRDFILFEDMSIPENYEIVKDQMQVVGLMDYMITNLNVVSQDWLNYNTGWWRGTNPDGDHKKWGYILWDNDATFDYYINYTGVPNTSPNAQPCDINQILFSMDNFYGGGFGGGGGGDFEGGMILSEPDQCSTIQDGSSPYDVSDSVYVQVVNRDNYCCCVNWDQICQGLYDDIIAQNNELPSNLGTCESIANGSCPYPEDDINFQITVHQFPSCCKVEWGNICETIYTQAAEGEFDSDCMPGENNGGGITDDYGDLDNSDVGKHEKIFLKLQYESPEFRQLYYSRQADLMNTVFSCENMNETLDSMLAIIEPEMPRQIQRWGGSMNQWMANVDRLKDFINQRCELLDDGMVDCFDLTGPFQITLKTQPIGVGEIEFNTLDLTSFPWTGNYFGEMENLIEAKSLDDGWEFSHWETTSGSAVTPDNESRKAAIMLEGAEELTAVFEMVSSTNELESLASLEVYPNPAKDQININYTLENEMDVNLNLYSILGEKIVSIPTGGQRNFSTQISIIENEIKPGVYFVNLTSLNGSISKKITIVE